VALLVLACLGAISLFLLATASANTELFAQRIDTLLVVNGVLGALLMAVVGTQLWQLWRKRRTGVFGSRLAVRLVLVFALVAVLPGALVYAASVMFIGRSIESWFDVRVDRALEGGLNLGRNALDYLKQETVNKANQIALTLAEGGPGTVSSRLNRAAEQAGVYEATLFPRPVACLRSPASAGRPPRPSRPRSRRSGARACSRPLRRRNKRRRVYSASSASWCPSTPTTSWSPSRCCR
jgi:nitrogen fixation/metabolism regulation signal transduction histidine kinase